MNELKSHWDGVTFDTCPVVTEVVMCREDDLFYNDYQWVTQFLQCPLYKLHEINYLCGKYVILISMPTKSFLQDASISSAVLSGVARIWKSFWQIMSQVCLHYYWTSTLTVIKHFYSNVLQKNKNMRIRKSHQCKKRPLVNVLSVQSILQWT